MWILLFVVSVVCMLGLTPVRACGSQGLRRRQFMELLLGWARDQPRIYLRAALCLTLVAGLSLSRAVGQNIPMGLGRNNTGSKTAFATEATFTAAIATPTPLTDCTDKNSDAPWGYPFFFPLNSNVSGGVQTLVGHDGKPIEVTSDGAIHCFFSTNQSLQPLSMVQYLYGFGSSPSTVSADLVSLTFPLGFQASFGSSITGGSKTSSATTATGQATPAQAVQQLQAGGDFYLRANYPIFYRNVGNNTTMLVFNPKLGFNISGFGSQNTITEATEYNWNESVEGYSEYRAFSSSADPGGALYIDARGGFQGVQGAFARSVGLSKTEFPMGQVSFGILFNGFIRVGAQRFFGPTQLYATAAGGPVTTQGDFKKWHLVLQLAPHK